MNQLDFVIVGMLALGALYGLSRGALRMMTSVVSLVAAIYIASLYYPVATRLVTSALAVRPALATALGYLAVFAVVFAAVEVAGRIAARLLAIVHLSWLDRLGGGALGLTVAGAVAGLLLMLLTASLPPQPPMLSRSELAPELLRYTEALLACIPPELKESYRTRRAELARLWLEGAPAPGAASSQATK